MCWSLSLTFFLTKASSFSPFKFCRWLSISQSDWPYLIVKPLIEPYFIGRLWSWGSSWAVFFSYNNANPGYDYYRFGFGLWLDWLHWYAHLRIVADTFSWQPIVLSMVWDYYKKYALVNLFLGYSRHQTVLKLIGAISNRLLNLVLFFVNIVRPLGVFSIYDWSKSRILLGFSSISLWIYPRSKRLANYVVSWLCVMAIDWGYGLLKTGYKRYALMS